MESNGVGVGGSGCRAGSIKAEELISKLKDDGDYDRLRVKIIRKLKENEKLRNDIKTMVKESAALRNPGIESMKPRKLADAIHKEIGDKVMSQISDGIWNIIRAPDGMKSEIRETVQLVYDKLSNPQENDCGESSSHINIEPVQNGCKNDTGISAPTSEVGGTLSDGEPNGPPGFALNGLHQRNKNIDEEKQPPNYGKAVEHVKKTVYSKDLQEPDNMDFDAPPGFPSILENKQSDDVGDDDPDVPPGFG